MRLCRVGTPHDVAYSLESWQSIVDWAVDRGYHYNFSIEGLSQKSGWHGVNGIHLSLSRKLRFFNQSELFIESADYALLFL